MNCAIGSPRRVLTRIMILMRKWLAVCFTLAFVFGCFAVTYAADNPLVDNEKAVWKTFRDLIPQDRILSVDQFYALYGKPEAFRKRARVR